MPVPGLSLLGLKRIRGFVSILRYINPTIIIIIISVKGINLNGSNLEQDELQIISLGKTIRFSSLTV